MILVMDVDYRQDKAVAAAIVLQDWKDEKPSKELIIECESGHAYVPGKFYRRELPCLLNLLDQFDIKFNVIVIDGYVSLGKERRPGLGQYLYEALNQQVAVIGVAKNAFKGTPLSMAIRRGKSQRPLYVTAVGMDEATARQCILKMPGSGRIPTLLKRVDYLCRTAP